MKITLAVPTNRGIMPQTMQSLMALVAHGGYDFHIIVPADGYTISENRNYVAVQALNNKSDYLLMIDDDMTFDEDLLDRLIANQKDICGGAYHPRSETGQVIKYLDKTTAIRLDDPEIKKDPKYQKTFECHATGTGVILIKCDIFLKIERPWFMFEYLPTGQCALGEDWYFCEKAKKFNIKTYADPTVRIGHLGEVIF